MTPPTIVQRPLPKFALILLLLSFLLFSSLPLRAQKTPAADFASLSKQAEAARDADRLNDAVALYKKALTLNPKWAEGWWSLGTLEYDRNNYTPAARAFAKLIVLSPQNGSAHAMLALCQYELGEFDPALQNIERAKVQGVAKNPQFRQVVLYHEGLLYLRKAKYNAAQEALRQLCTENTNDPKAVQGMGMAALRITMDESLAQDASQLAIVQQVGQAECLAAAQKYDQARSEYAGIASRYSDQRNIHYAYGKFLMELNDIPGAVEQFKLEIQNYPDDVTSRLEIAAAQYKVDSAAGLPYAQEALRLAPKIMFTHYLLGLLYLDTGNFQDAIPHLELAVKSFPKDPDVYFSLSSAYMRAGRKADGKKALAEFEHLKKEANEKNKASY